MSTARRSRRSRTGASSSTTSPRSDDLGHYPERARDGSDRAALFPGQRHLRRRDGDADTAWKVGATDDNATRAVSGCGSIRSAATFDQRLPGPAGGRPHAGTRDDLLGHRAADSVGRRAWRRGRRRRQDDPLLAQLRPHRRHRGAASATGSGTRTTGATARAWTTGRSTCRTTAARPGSRSRTHSIPPPNAWVADVASTCCTTFIATPGIVQFRFIAEDASPGSLVEARSRRLPAHRGVRCDRMRTATSPCGS